MATIGVKVGTIQHLRVPSCDPVNEVQREAGAGGAPALPSPYLHKATVVINGGTIDDIPFKGAKLDPTDHVWRRQAWEVPRACPPLTCTKADRLAAGQVQRMK